MDRPGVLETIARICLYAALTVPAAFAVLAATEMAPPGSTVLLLGTLAAAAAFYSLGVARGQIKLPAWTPRLLPWLLFFLVALAAVLFSGASWHCLFGSTRRGDGLLLVGAQLLAFLGAYGFCREEAQGRRFGVLLFLGGCVAALAVLVQAVDARAAVAEDAATYLALVLSLGLGLFWLTGGAPARLALLGACLLLFGAILFAGKPSVLVGLLAAWAYLFTQRAASTERGVHRLRNWWLLSAALFVLAAVAFALNSLAASGGVAAGLGEVASFVRMRFCTWSGAVALMLRKPLLGHGPGLFYCLLPGVAEPALGLWRESWALPQVAAGNGFLEAAVAFGLPGLLLAMAVFYVALRAAKQAAPFIAAPLVCLLVNGLLFSWDMVTSLSLWALCGAALHARAWAKRKGDEYYSIVEMAGPIRGSWNKTALGFGGFAVACLLAGWSLSVLRAELCHREARAYLFAGRAEQAVDYGWRGLSCQPYLGHFYLQQAELHVRTGLSGKWGFEGWREAELLLQRAWELNPFDPVSHAGLARLYLEIYRRQGGDWYLASALRQNNLALKLAPGDFYLMMARIEMLFESQDYERVKRACAKAKALFPLAGQPYNFSAHLAIRAGDLGRAVREMEKAVRLEWHGDDNARADLYSNLAKIYSDNEQHGKALERVKMAVALDPSFEDARYNLGWILSKLGRPEEAALAWRELLQLNPEHEMAIRALGELEKT